MNLQVRATIGDWLALVVSDDFLPSCCPSVANVEAGGSLAGDDLP